MGNARSLNTLRSVRAADRAVSLLVVNLVWLDLFENRVEKVDWRQRLQVDR